MNSILEKIFKKKNKSDFLILILLGVMVMIVAVPGGTKTAGKKEQTATENTQSVVQSEDDYRKELEERLENLLAKMQGVGKVRVMLTLSDEGYEHLDKNSTKDGQKKEEETVVYGTGESEKPYVVRKEMPKVEGVVVVAQGGGNAQTVTQISEAVMSLFQIEAHKVVVVKMSVQEE